MEKFGATGLLISLGVYVIAEVLYYHFFTKREHSIYIAWRKEKPEHKR